MADFSFGVEGIMNAIALQGQLQQQQQARARFEQDQELYPLQLQEAQAKARSETIKATADAQDYQHQQDYEKAVREFVQTGKAKGLSPDQKDSALSDIALDNGLYGLSADLAGKAATTGKDRVDMLTKQLDQVRGTHDLIASHLDNVRSQADLDPAIDSAVLDLAQAGASSKIIEGMRSLKGKPFQQVKTEYTQRILTAQQQLEAQKNAAEATYQGIEGRLDVARTTEAATSGEIKKMQLDFYKKNGYTPPGGAGLDSDTQVVLGALQAAHITVPGGMNGKQIQERVQAYMSYIPRFEDEDINDYATRVAQAAVQGGANLAAATAGGRRIGTTAGAITVGSEAILEDGGLKDQYLDAINAMDLSSYKPLQIGQKAFAWATSDPTYGALMTAAQGIASDWQQVLARGGQNVDAQVKAREILSATSPADAEARINQTVKEMRAVERAAKAASRGTAGSIDRPDTPKKAPPSSGWGAATVVQ